MTTDSMAAGLFSARRSELERPSGPLPALVISVLSESDRRSFLVLRNSDSVRILDFWSSPDGLCVHTRTGTDAESPGSFAAAELAELHLASVIAELLVAVPPAASSQVPEIDAADLTGAAELPDGVVSLGAVSSAGAPGPRSVFVSTRWGCLLGSVSGPSARMEIQPASMAEVWSELRGGILGL